jgi:hypothetical protein
MLKPVHAYVDRLHDIHAVGQATPEVSYRAALEVLLNAIGETLDPDVHSVHELTDSGAGRPDFGLFERRSNALRSVVECKGFAQSLTTTADGRQVSAYWQHYGCVLVTNYREFWLVVRRSATDVRVEMRYSLSESPEEFWATSPRKLADEHEAGLADFLAGALTRSAPITRPEQLAEDLARYAREARRRLERQPIEDLRPLQAAMEEALGLHFEGPDGAAFFRSSLVQTLFYGLFSGWILWRQSGRRNGGFDWKDAGEHLALPLVGDLYEEVARPHRLANLQLREPLEWASTSLNRVVEDEFFQRFDREHAITLFYEPFLQRFDPQLRKELGVWYTPPEIVEYMVERVDQLLRTELGIEDGLANDQVYVLDPAAGTGSYLVRVAQRIHQTLTEQGHGTLAGQRVKQALRTRIFGFEILPAPYVVAHLQLGVLLAQLAAPLAAQERCEVYLTNALTGWEPAREPKTALLFPELHREAERARRVKREAPILVILGNPPYNGFAGVALEEEADLIAPYKQGLSATWGVRKQLLDDLYVRFFRLAERRISEFAKRGIVCLISNNSWLDGLSHVVMRERMVHGFDQIWIDNCNGDRYRTGKRTPDGGPDQSMFTTDKQPVGIQVGTGIVTLVRTATKRPQDANATVRYRDLWGFANEKRTELLRTLTRRQVARSYRSTKSTLAHRWVLTPQIANVRYSKWTALDQLFAEVFKGLQPGRSGALVKIDRETLGRQMQRYFDPAETTEDLLPRFPELMKAEAGYNPREVRQRLLAAQVKFDGKKIQKIEWLPFDRRFVYWESAGKLLHRKREEFAEQVFDQNLLLACTQKPRKGSFSAPFLTNVLGSYYVFDPYTTYFSRRTRHQDLDGPETIAPGIRPAVLDQLCTAWRMRCWRGESHHWSDRAFQLNDWLFAHTLAVLWSGAYSRENSAALRIDWPRVPIPATLKQLEKSAALGERVADLLLVDRSVRGVTTGTITTELRPLGALRKHGGGPLDPDLDLKIDAGWGFLGKGNAVMCGKGRVAPNSDDPLGALDIFLNEQVYWERVPKPVWDTTIGGYPVLKKWLSYREHRILGRPITSEEASYITTLIRRLQALRDLSAELDANYEAIKEETLSLD